MTDPITTDPDPTRAAFFNALGRIPDELRTLSSGERVRIPGRTPSQARFENLELRAPEELSPGGRPISNRFARKRAKELGLDMNEMRPVVELGQEPKIYKQGPRGTVRFIDNPPYSPGTPLMAPRYRRLTPELVDEWAKLKESGEFLLRDHPGWIKPSVDRAEILKAVQTVFERSRRPYFIRPTQTQTPPSAAFPEGRGYTEQGVPYPRALAYNIAETKNIIRSLHRKEGLNTDRIRIFTNARGWTSLEQELIDRVRRNYGPEAEQIAIDNLNNLKQISIESAESNIPMPLESLGRESNTFTSMELKGLGNLGIDTSNLNAPTPSWRRGSSALDAVTGRSTTSNLPPMLQEPPPDPRARTPWERRTRPKEEWSSTWRPAPEQVTPYRVRPRSEAITGRAPFEQAGFQPYGTIRRTRQDDLRRMADLDHDINYNWRPDPDHFTNTPNALPRNEMALKSRRAIIGDAGNKAIEDYTAKGTSTQDLMAGGKGNEDAVMAAATKIATTAMSNAAKTTTVPEPPTPVNLEGGLQ